MKNLFNILTVSLVLVLAGGIAFGTNYYVDEAPTGDDSNDGSSGSPWATLQYAVETIGNGDTILVQPGTYAGCRIEYSGTAGNPKTLKAETAGTVLLNSLSGEARHSGILEVENYSASVEYWTIEGFECDGNSGSYRPIDVRNSADQQNSHITIRNCVAYDGSSTGIFNSHTNYALIEDCTSYDNGEHGFYVNNSADNGVLRNNISYTNTSNGIHMNGDESMGGDGIMSSWLVEDNVCYDNPSQGINCDGVTDSTFRNNLLYEVGSKGFSLYGIDGAVTSKNDLIYNNTVLSESTGTVGYYNIFIHRNTQGAGDPTGMRIKNNILYNYRTATNRGSICMHTSGMSDFESDYNVVMEYFGIDDNSSVDDFAEWQVRGYDLNSIQATDTDLFTDPSTYDYTLKSGSPAIDAGTTIASVTDDIDGASRPQGSAYDIGCYESDGTIQDLVITTTSLPNGEVSSAYSQTLAATGGVTPYSWSITVGSLPSGLLLAPSTGVISGTPTTEETQGFTVQVTDDQGTPDTDTQALSITIDPEPEPPTITTSSLPDGTKNQAYSETVVATGGTTPYTWTVVSGDLGNGLSLNSSTGVISGTPRGSAGTRYFTIRCTGDDSLWDEQALSITINN